MGVSADKIKEAVNYKSFYGGFVKLSGTGPEYSVKCPFPFHKDGRPSFQINTDNGLWNCKSAGCASNSGKQGGGDIVRFVELMNDISFQNACDHLGDILGVPSDGAGVIDLLDDTAFAAHHAACVARLAQDKPALKALITKRGWSPKTIAACEIGWDGSRYTIPVYDINNELSNLKQYHWDLDPKITNVKGRGKMAIFNAPYLADPGNRRVIICEGETDVITAIHYGFPQVVSSTGGSTGWDSDWNGLFQGREVFIIYDTDKAGRKGAKKVAMQLMHVADRVYDIDLPLDPEDYPTGDLSDFLRTESPQALADLLVHAKPFKPVGTHDIAWAMANQTPGFELTDNRILKIQVKDEAVIKHRLNSAPLWPSRYGEDSDTEIKYLELCWQDEEGAKSRFFERVEVMDSASLKHTTKFGVPVTSTNASGVVDYIDGMQEVNRDQLPKVMVTTRNGWHGEDFAALPSWSRKSYVFGNDIIGSTRDIVQALGEEAGRPFQVFGNLNDWMDLSEEVYNSSYISRAYIFASLAGFLIKPLGIRSWVFHNYALTRSGKSAILKYCASIVGNPGRLMQSMNATDNAIEGRLHRFTDQPIMLDELQLNTDPDFRSKAIYLICQGQGKARATRTGGMRKVVYWDTVALITGEQPIITASDLGGQASRVLEIPGAPCPNEDFAVSVHQRTKRSFGHGGRLFVKNLMEVDYDTMIRLYNEAVGGIRDNLSEKVVGSLYQSVASMAVAAYYWNRWIRGNTLTMDQILGEELYPAFDEVNVAEHPGVKMAKYVYQLTLRYRRGFQEPNPPGIMDRHDISQYSVGRKYYIRAGVECLGRLPKINTSTDEIEGEVWILKSVMEDWLNRKGYNYEMARRHWKKMGLLVTDSGGKTDSRPESIGGFTKAVVKLKWLTDEELEAIK